MELIRKTHIDFLSKSPIFLVLSLILLSVSVWSLMGGINRGIDFAGGTELQVKFSQAPAIDDLRRSLNQLDLGDVDIQSIGEAAEGEFIIRVGSQQKPGTVSAQEQEPAAAVEDAGAELLQQAEEIAVGDEASPAGGSAGMADTEAAAGATTTEDTAATAAEAAAPRQGEQARVYRAVLGALHQLTGTDADDARLDLNMANVYEMRSLLARRPGALPGDAALAEAISAYRRDHAGLFGAWGELDQVDGMNSDIRGYLEQEAQLGPFTVRRVAYVGPRVGGELARKAYLAMVFALAGMLVYITVRFRKLGFALGGITALVHDGILAAGVFNLWGGQFDLTIVAAILTLLGYSINDTIVIFDRVRENMRTMRGRSQMEIFNASINQTLSRTVLTSLTTLLVVFCLYSFGGETIHGFAFVLLFGILVGTYSTIFIASPVVIHYSRWIEGRKASSRTVAAATEGAGKRPSRGRR